MEDQGGWFKVWRKLFKNPVFQNNDPYLFKTFMYCLCRANHKENEVLMDGKLVKLSPGEFITGRFEASKDLHFKSKMWDRKLVILEKLQILTKQVTNRYTKISIINWNSYQGSLSNDDQVSDPLMTKSGPSHDQVMTTDKNDKNVKNDKNKEVEDVLVSKKKRKTSYPADEEFILSLKDLYPYIDIDQELNKMKAWLMTPKGRGRQLNRRFIVNWLNKIDKPISTGEVAPINEQDRKSWEIKKALDKIKWKERDKNEYPEPT